MTDTALQRITLPLHEVFEPHLTNALLRFGYLWPDAEVKVQQGYVTIALDRKTEEVALVAQDFQFCLYREKIYRETLPLRNTLIGALMGR